MNTKRAQVTELFSSIQGEGIFLGARQIFVRFAKCNMNCSFCDEPKGLEPKSFTSLELMREVKYLDLSHGPHHSVSLTGGEPLLRVDFLKIFAKILKREDFKPYLETNGTLPGALAQVIELVDIIAMDFKLPSSTGERPYWDEHGEFLKIARRKKVFVKAVITADTSRDDIEKAMALVAGVGENIPFILQPATPVRAGDAQVKKETLLKFLEIGSRRHLDNIRVIPQIHKILNVK